MIIIQGFVQIPNMANNAVGMVADFGEFSDKSMTFSKDIRNLADTNLYPDIEVITVRSVDDSDKPIATIPPDISSKILIVANWLLQQSNAGNIPTNPNKANLATGVETEIDNVTGVKFGELLTTSQSGKRLPDYIEFNTVLGNEQYQIKLWYNDQRFQAQYRYYDLVIIPPIDDLMSLTGGIIDVEEKLRLLTTASLVPKVNAQNTIAKFTEIISYRLVWHELDAPSNTLNTDWTIIVYGNAGVDTESIKGAIKDYLATNTTFDRWQEIFPDLFSNNEFIIVPIWDNVVTGKSTYDDGLYISAIPLGTLRNKIESKLPRSYVSSDLVNSEGITVVPTTYRGMTVLVLGNPIVKGVPITFNEFIKNYMVIPTTDPDFARNDKITQDFTVMLLASLEKARLYDENKPIPQGYTNTKRMGRDYIGFDFEGFSFSVITRSGYLRA